MFKAGPFATDAEVALAAHLPPAPELEHLHEYLRALSVENPPKRSAAAQQTFDRLRSFFGEMASENGAIDSMHFLKVVLPSLIEASKNAPYEAHRRWQEEHDDPRKVY